MTNDPHDRDKLEDLWLQLKGYEKAQRVGQVGGSIICPWCFKANKPGVAQCCPDFKRGVDARGARNLERVVDQMRDIRLGKRRGFDCPYCETRLKAPDKEMRPADWPRQGISPFCCDLLSEAVAAITLKMGVDAKAEEMRRIEDATARGHRARAVKAAVN